MLKLSHKVFLGLLLFSFFLVACPKEPTLPQGNATMQNGIVRLEVKTGYVYGIGLSKEKAEMIATGMGDAVQFVSLCSNKASLNGRNGDTVKIFVIDVASYGITGFTNATELASWTLDKTKTPMAFPTPTGDSIEVTGDKESLIITKMSSEKDRLICVKSTSSIAPGSSFDDVDSIYEGEEVTSSGIVINNLDEYLYFYRLSENGTVYSDAYAIDIEVYLEGVYKLQIMPGVSNEKEKNIYYSSKKEAWYKTNSIAESSLLGKTSSGIFLYDTVPEGYSYLIRFTNEKFSSLKGEKAAFAGAKDGDEEIVDANGKLKVTSLFKNRVCSLFFAESTGELKSIDLPTIEEEDQDGVFLGWTRVNNDLQHKENISVPYIPGFGEIILLKDNWVNVDAPNNAYNYKDNEQKKAKDMYSKSRSLILRGIVDKLYNLETDTYLSGTRVQEISDNVKIYFLNDVQIDYSSDYMAEKVKIKGLSGVIRVDKLAIYADITFNSSDKIELLNVCTYDYFILDDMAEYALKSYFIGDSTDKSKAWIVEDGKSYTFKDIDLTFINFNRTLEEPGCYEPSDRDKATLDNSQRILLKTMIIGDIDPNDFLECAEKKQYRDIGNSGVIGEKYYSLKASTAVVQESTINSNSRIKYYVDGIINSSDYVNIIINLVTDPDGNFCSESFIKYNNEFWFKDSTEFKTFVDSAIEIYEIESEKVGIARIALDAFKHNIESSNLKRFDFNQTHSDYVVFRYAYSPDDYTPVSYVKFETTECFSATSHKIEFDEDQFVEHQRVYDLRVNITDEFQVRSFYITSANVKYKVSKSGELLGVYKDSEIKIDDKIVKLSELFKEEISKNPDFLYQHTY